MANLNREDLKIQILNDPEVSAAFEARDGSNAADVLFKKAVLRARDKLQSTAQSAIQPAAQSATQPAAQSATQPAAQSATQPAAKPAAKPAAQPTQQFEPNKLATATDYSIASAMSLDNTSNSYSTASDSEWKNSFVRAKKSVATGREIADLVFVEKIYGKVAFGSVNYSEFNRIPNRVIIEAANKDLNNIHKSSGGYIPAIKKSLQTTATDLIARDFNDNDESVFNFKADTAFYRLRNAMFSLDFTTLDGFNVAKAAVVEKYFPNFDTMVSAYTAREVGTLTETSRKYLLASITASKILEQITKDGRFLNTDSTGLVSDTMINLSKGFHWSRRTLDFVSGDEVQHGKRANFRGLFNYLIRSFAGVAQTKTETKNMEKEIGSNNVSAEILAIHTRALVERLVEHLRYTPTQGLNKLAHNYATGPAIDRLIIIKEILNKSIDEYQGKTGDFTTDEPIKQALNIPSPPVVDESDRTKLPRDAMFNRLGDN